MVNDSVIICPECNVLPTRHKCRHCQVPVCPSCCDARGLTDLNQMECKKCQDDATDIDMSTVSTHMRQNDDDVNHPSQSATPPQPPPPLLPHIDESLVTHNVCKNPPSSINKSTLTPTSIIFASTNPTTDNTTTVSEITNTPAKKNSVRVKAKRKITTTSRKSARKNK